MKKKAPTVATPHLGPRELAEVQACALPWSLVLHYEEHGWPSLALELEAWERVDVPERFRGTEAPDRPDSRLVLSPKPDVIAAFNEARTAWELKAEQWSRARLCWLKSAAAKEKK